MADAITYTSSERANDLVTRRAKVRVYTRGLRSLVAEGEVIGYCAAPTLLIRHADGSQSSWSVDLDVVEVAPPCGCDCHAGDDRG